MQTFHTNFKDREAESLRNSKKAMRLHNNLLDGGLFLFYNTMSKRVTNDYRMKISNHGKQAKALHALQIINEFKQMWPVHELDHLLWEMLISSIGNDKTGQTANERVGQLFLYQKIKELARALQSVNFE